MSQPTRRSRRSSRRPARGAGQDREARTQQILAVLVLLWVAGTAFAMITFPEAAAVFDRILPLLTLIVGFYFGQRRDQTGGSRHQ